MLLLAIGVVTPARIAALLGARPTLETAHLRLLFSPRGVDHALAEWMFEPPPPPPSPAAAAAAGDATAAAPPRPRRPPRARRRPFPFAFFSECQEQPIAPLNGRPLASTHVGSLHYIFQVATAPRRCFGFVCFVSRACASSARRGAAAARCVACMRPSVF